MANYVTFKHYIFHHITKIYLEIKKKGIQNSIVWIIFALPISDNIRNSNYTISIANPEFHDNGVELALDFISNSRRDCINNRLIFEGQR